MSGTGRIVWPAMGMRVVVAEDSYLIREGLRLMLATQDDMELVASVATLSDLLAAVETHVPDVVVTDVRMPPGHRDDGSVLDPQVVEALVGAGAGHPVSPLSRLTPRESEVLALVATGLSNAAIAARLVLTGRAVEKHITSMLMKLDLDPDDTDVNRRVRAVLLYLSSASG